MSCRAQTKNYPANAKILLNNIHMRENEIEISWCHQALSFLANKLVVFLSLTHQNTVQFSTSFDSNIFGGERWAQDINHSLLQPDFHKT